MREGEGEGEQEEEEVRGGSLLLLLGVFCVL